MPADPTPPAEPLPGEPPVDLPGEPPVDLPGEPPVDIFEKLAGARRAVAPAPLSATRYPESEEAAEQEEQAQDADDDRTAQAAARAEAEAELRAQGHAEVTDLGEVPAPGGTGAVRAPSAYAAARNALGGIDPVPGVPKPDPALVADGVRRSFGGLTAVDVGHLEVQRGIVTGLIGPNGAGKTTLFNLLTGFDKADAGTWSLDGTRLSGLPAHRVASAGLVRTFQLTKALSKLTVRENMLLGAKGQRGESFFPALVPALWRGQEQANSERAMVLLERFGLAAKAGDFAGEMSGGQRKLLEMARALMSSPRVLCLDEPMAGVNPALTQSILQHVKTLRDDGLTIVFVEHDMDVIREVCDWVVVMAAGSLVAEGPPDAILSDQRVIDAYLGAHHDAPLSIEEENVVLELAEAQIADEEGVA